MWPPLALLGGATGPRLSLCGWYGAAAGGATRRACGWSSACHVEQAPKYQERGCDDQCAGTPQADASPSACWGRCPRTKTLPQAATKITFFFVLQKKLMGTLPAESGLAETDIPGRA